MTFLSRILGALLFGLLVILNLSAQAQAWQWATQSVATVPPPPSQPTSFVLTTATALTAGGEMDAAYRYLGAITLGGQTYTSSLLGGAAMVHLNDAGTVVAPVMHTANGWFSAIKRDAAGNRYAVGYFGGQLTVGSAQFTAQGVNDYFVAKWNPSGTLQWLKQVAHTDTILAGVFVSVDGAGNVLLATNYTRTVSVAGQSLTATASGYSMFLAQFDAVGNFRWLRGSADDTNPTVVFVTGAEAAPDGTIQLVGSLFNTNSFRWGTTVVQITNTQSNYWLKLDAYGNFLGQAHFGEAAFNGPRLAMDAAGTAYVSSRNTAGTFGWEGASFTSLPGNTAGIFIARLGANGTPQWVQNASLLNAGHVESWGLCISDDVSGGGGNPRVFLSGELSAAAGTSDFLVCGQYSVFTRGGNQNDGFLLALDGLSGTPEWLIPVAHSTSNEQISTLNANAAGELSVGGFFQGDSAQFGGIQLLNNVPLRQVGFTAKLTPNYNLLQGTVFADVNGSGTRDVGEPGRAGVVIEAQTSPTTSSAYFASNADGQYSAVADLSTYVVNVPNPPRYYTVVPTGPTTASFSTYGNLSTGHDFALQPIGPRQDLQITLTPVTRARPGFAVRYRLTARNVGTVPVSAAALHLTTDPLLAYVSSTAAGTHTGATTDWLIGALQPGETRQFDALFQLAITAPLGHVLTATALLDPTTGDLTPTDNLETSTLTVTGSYDPNDIAVNYATLTLPQVQNAIRPLDYTVRFQNMGTDTAFTVTLRDTLPAALLNLGTLQLLSASHTCTWRLGAGGVLTVSFPNIHLPDRNTNTLRSMGFVRFRVVPYTTLAAGDVIPNQVQIYFDFNPAVATNTALTTVVNPTGLAPVAATLSGGAWPNPATTALNVAVARPAGAAAQVMLTDALGRVVRTAALPAGPGEAAETTLDLRGLAPGLYVVRAAAGGRQWSQRVVVR